MPAKNGHNSALFVRANQPVNRIAQHAAADPAGRSHVPQSLRDAFAGFAQMRLLDAHGSDETHLDGAKAARVLVALEEYGFTREQIRRARFGLYSTPDDVRHYLRGIGFSEREIAESGLVSGPNGELRNAWSGRLVVPVEGESGRTADLVLIDLAADPQHPRRCCGVKDDSTSPQPLYDIEMALQSPESLRNLIVVEDVLDAWYLRMHGVPNVAAIGGTAGLFTAFRWEDLSRHNISSVTLVFRNWADSHRAIYDALGLALRARTAPEVFFVEPSELSPGPPAARYVEAHGIDAFRRLIAGRTRAFHSKSYGYRYWPEEAEASRWLPHAAEERSPWLAGTDGYRSYLAACAERLPHAADRARCLSLLDEIDRALRQRHFARARMLLSSLLETIAEPVPQAPVIRTRPTAVVERLVKHTGEVRLPEGYGRYDGHELQPGQFAVLDVESAEGALAALCSRIVTFLETRPGEGCAVFCREFSEELIVLGLITHLTRRMTQGFGMTLEQVRIRLSGADPVSGYEDKPWLIDEAVDRVENWSKRIAFVRGVNSCEALRAEAARLTHDEDATFLICDREATAAFEMQSRRTGMSSSRAGFCQQLSAVAAEFDCAFVALSGPVKTVHDEAFTSAPWCRTSYRQDISLQELHGMAANWIESEERRVSGRFSGG